jgi:hypothetical protein
MTETYIPLGKAVLQKKTWQLLLRKPTFKTHYWFNLVANNGEPICKSEQYTQKHNATEVIDKYFPDFLLVDETGE